MKKTCGSNAVGTVVFFITSIVTVITPHENLDNKKPSSYEQQAAYFGTQDADAWRIAVIKQALHQMGYDTVPPVKKLSHRVHQEMQINGCSTRKGIWLLHHPGMHDALAYYIAVHEAAHYAHNHSLKRHIATQITHNLCHVSTALSIALTGYCARTSNKPLAVLVSCASALSIACNNFVNYYANKFLPWYVEHLEKEADQKAVACITQAQRKDVLDYLLMHDQFRKKAHTDLAHQIHEIKKGLYKNNNVDLIWTAQAHIKNIKEYYQSDETKSS